MFDEWTVRGHEGVDLGERQDVVAVGARHLVIDFRDHHAGGGGGGPGGVAGGPERAHAVAVGRRNLQQGHVKRDTAAEKQGGDIRKEDRDEIGAGLGDGLA
jgi:hypothetical protein